MTIATLNARLRNAIIGTGVLQVLPLKNKKLSVFCREVPGQGKEWLKAVDRLLLRVEMLNLNGTDVDVLIARRYMRKDNRVAFCWYIEVEGKNAKLLESVIWEFESTLASVQPEAAPMMTALPVAEESAAAPGRTRPLAPGKRPGVTARKKKPSADDLTPGESQLPPEGFKSALVLASSGRDEKGAPTSEEVMPLPHVYRPMNEPNEKGRGAKKWGT